MHKLGYLMNFGKDFLMDSQLSKINPNIFYTMRELISSIRSSLCNEFLILLEGIDLPADFLLKLESHNKRIRDLCASFKRPASMELLDSFVLEDDCKDLSPSAAFESLKIFLVELEIKHVELLRLQRTFRADVLLGRVAGVSRADFGREVSSGGPATCMKSQSSKSAKHSLEAKAFLREQKLISEVVLGLENLEKQLHSRPGSLEIITEKKLTQEATSLIGELRGDILFNFTQNAFLLLKSINDIVKELEGRVMDLLGQLINSQMGRKESEELHTEMKPMFSTILSKIHKKRQSTFFSILDEIEEEEKTVLTKNVPTLEPRLLILPETKERDEASGESKPDKAETKEKNAGERERLPQHPRGCRLYCAIF